MAPRARMRFMHLRCRCMHWDHSWRALHRALVSFELLAANTATLCNSKIPHVNAHPSTARLL